MSMQNEKLVIILSLCFIFCVPLSHAQVKKPKRRALAVIVNVTNPIKGLTSTQLRKTMTLSVQFWKNKKRIVLLQRPRKSPETRLLLKRVYKMSDRKLKKFWVSQLFNGRIPGIPSTIRSTTRTIHAVKKSANAVSVVFADEATSDVRILRIDGKLPGEKGYPLILEPSK